MPRVSVGYWDRKMSSQCWSHLFMCHSWMWPEQAWINKAVSVIRRTARACLLVACSCPLPGPTPQAPVSIPGMSPPSPAGRGTCGCGPTLPLQGRPTGPEKPPPPPTTHQHHLRHVIPPKRSLSTHSTINTRLRFSTIKTLLLNYLCCELSVPMGCGIAPWRSGVLMGSGSVRWYSGVRMGSGSVPGS